MAKYITYIVLQTEFDQEVPVKCVEMAKIVQLCLYSIHSNAVGKIIDYYTYKGLATEQWIMRANKFLYKT